MVKKASILLAKGALLVVLIGLTYAVLIVVTFYSLWFVAHGFPVAVVALTALGFGAGWHCRARAA